ncbi:N-acylneuraminate cytidylyltransferase isoform X2 [Ischnura elegans]|nr:N-acylneuraminate cytidylyltransferase isoform X2 [Ischnura elegans]
MKTFGKFSSIWVSTDHPDIAQEAERLGVFVHWRSAETATDTASSLFSVQEFCSRMPGISNIGLIQCTSPFLSSDIMLMAYELLSRGYDSAFSVTRTHNLLWKETSNGEITPANFDRRRRPRRQDWNGNLQENGMLYFTSIDCIKFGLLQGGRIGYVEVPQLQSLEIDSKIDLRIAEILFDAHLFDI